MTGLVSMYIYCVLCSLLKRPYSLCNGHYTNYVMMMMMIMIFYLMVTSFHVVWWCSL